MNAACDRKRLATHFCLYDFELGPKGAGPCIIRHVSGRAPEAEGHGEPEPCVLYSRLGRPQSVVEGPWHLRPVFGGKRINEAEKGVQRVAEGMRQTGSSW